MLYVFLSFIFPFWLISDIILSNFCHLGYNNLTKKYKQKRKNSYSIQKQSKEKLQLYKKCKSDKQTI